jgi:hypothetical protein
MKLLHYTTVVASALCLILSLALFTLEKDNQRMRADIRRRQQERQKWDEQIAALFPGHANTIGSHKPDPLRDMAIVSLKDQKMKELLKKHGFMVNYGSAASPHPDSSPASATAPSGTSSVRP